ncbi:hypothetical protein QYN14_00055 [Rhodococcus ruber]|uniref:hypothetical protein n=1 Tax=Rhodococcus ruber TaxID=1830 RepID=UPI0026587638|nr:hypothetical protein [Rhodococcus ruber]WKK11977.1 hypothetical protein QYN14_25445 [Rhodococcus ruber]WKK12050.1 hypothetical protein QYN14_00055 [Rhodococcus ruber]
MTLEEQITDCLFRLRRARFDRDADAVKLLSDRLDTLLSRVPRTQTEEAVPA